ncbi:MAG: hypothetical protein LBC93_09180, partial [Synergistaceae bacterium]|nr:hypothetical protein [Synergistaceae bacterium]
WLCLFAFAAISYLIIENSCFLTLFSHKVNNLPLILMRLPWGTLPHFLRAVGDGDKIFAVSGLGCAFSGSDGPLGSAATIRQRWYM